LKSSQSLASKGLAKQQKNLIGELKTHKQKEESAARRPKIKNHPQNP